MFGDRFSSSTSCSRWVHETEPDRPDQSLTCCFLKVATHPHELIANNAIHAGMVRGETYKPGTPMITDLSIQFDGETVAEWTKINWPDDVLQAVGWLADQLAQSGLSLEKGQTILTGALGPPLPVGDANQVKVVSSRFGTVEASFA